MDDGAELLVGELFASLAEEGRTETREALLEVYQDSAVREREALSRTLLSELLALLDARLDRDAEVEILANSVGSLVERFSAIVQSIPAAVVVIDADRSIQFWSDGAERLFGWNESRVTGRSYAETLAESPATLDDLLSSLVSGESLTGVESSHRHANGSTLDVQLWGAPLAGESTDGASLFVTDISEQKQREQRLMVLNRLFRHNIRNDVTVIRGHLDLLSDERQSEHIDIIADRIEDIRSLSEAAQQIEQLQHSDETERRTFDPSALLCDRIGRLRTEQATLALRQDVRVTGRVVGHELLPYALDNVLDNAVEHNDAETPRIDVTAEPASGSDRVIFRIADNGPGLPDTEQSVLTTGTETPLAHSTGTGLWLTQWIVRESDGSISVSESRFGGTEVEIRLRRPVD
ncbi:histidine kinase [Haloarcula taiwanensis]|uniref:histidine kinase n=1 Tax=Haloarcula taiwanensis TaxID=1932004 RepID=A0A2H4ZZD1_9EURY|nr:MULTISPECIES: PAS domain S-box protein [Haloarcula]AUG47841.1 histidine kinase [Haloarcula taiwanensis]RLM47094.1 PAS domain S-box protein [Haloarcula sp. Atlit-47R]RLM89924.1 PAS domain S-box protein [Haloarcula sp. Atlit-7R]